jgi:hypothetical protein
MEVGLSCTETFPEVPISCVCHELQTDRSREVSVWTNACRPKDEHELESEGLGKYECQRGPVEGDSESYKTSSDDRRSVGNEA